MKHKIDTRMVSAKQMVKKLNELDPYETMTKGDWRNETEEQIEQSLENLNLLLAQKGKGDGEKKKVYRKMAERMNIRLDSTSPVRQVKCDRDGAGGNPFVYEREGEYEVPCFKPRSVIDGNEDVMTRVSKPKSVVTAITTQGRDRKKLLEKDKECQGSYLNAKVLEVGLAEV